MDAVQCQVFSLHWPLAKNLHMKILRNVKRNEQYSDERRNDNNLLLSPRRKYTLLFTFVAFLIIYLLSIQRHTTETCPPSDALSLEKWNRRTDGRTSRKNRKLKFMFAEWHNAVSPMHLNRRIFKRTEHNCCLSVSNISIVFVFIRNVTIFFYSLLVVVDAHNVLQRQRRRREKKCPIFRSLRLIVM